MSDSNEGIQKLLAAEDEANKIIRDARDQKAVRLREAEREAEKAMGELREKLEKELAADPELEDKSFESFAKQLDDETKASVKDIGRQYEENKEAVLSLLLHHVTHVKLECSEAMKQAVLTKEKEAQAAL